MSGSRRTTGSGAPKSSRRLPAPAFPGTGGRFPVKERRRRREISDPPVALVRAAPAARDESPRLSRGWASPDRQGGWLLLEAMIALTVLTVGILGFMFSFQANFRATREMGYRDLAQVAMESAAETLASSNFGSLYATYQNALFPATGLVGPDGNPAVVRVQFNVNETALPAEYGPVADIDGDGAKTTLNASTSYVLLPTCLTLSYQMSFGTETKVLYLVLGP